MIYRRVTVSADNCSVYFDLIVIITLVSTDIANAVFHFIKLFKAYVFINANIFYRN